MKDFITVDEAAKLAGVARNTIYTLHKDGVLKGYRLPGRQRGLLLKKQDVQAAFTPQPLTKHNS